MQTAQDPFPLAIIGAGVSGLSSAYFLLKQARPGDRPLQIDIFERKASYGGNADTAVVKLGEEIGGDGQRTAFHRWADLGVNDVNLATYVKLKAIMEEIGYLQHMKPLQDTTSYFNASGSLALADDAELRQGVSNPRYSLHDADHGLLEPLIKVVHQSALDALADVRPEDTVAQFFEQCIASPEARLGKAASALGIRIDWNDKQLPARLATVRDAIYYPRIAAMYFTDDRGPGMMPLQSPFEYYRLQEGQGDKAQKADRRYFDFGAQKWLEALAAWLLAHSSALVKIAIHPNADVSLHVRKGMTTVVAPGVMSRDFPLCILAVHADDARAMLHFDASMASWQNEIVPALMRVRYTHTYAVCHTDARKLPQNLAIWRTYNVLQRAASDTDFSYRMTYVENLHQNDAANPAYAHAGLPLFLTSMVRSLDEIAEENMLERVSSAQHVAPDMLAALPQATRRQLQGEALHGGYREQNQAIPANLANKALTSFKHNVLDAACIKAQQLIAAYNSKVAASIARVEQPECALLFGGGWTLGAGLQEQCLAQSEQLAGAILPGMRPALSPAAAPAPAACATAA